jgi:hypothetical protein
MKQYLVTYVCEYEVEALDEDEAIDIALEMHAELPDGAWEVTLVDQD